MLQMSAGTVQQSLKSAASPGTLQAIETLQHLSELFFERRCQLAREVGLTVEQWRVLEQIADEHFMPSMFAKSRDCSAAAVSKVLRQLIERGLVDVSVAAAGEGDARRRRYRLTADGKKTMGKLRESREKAIEAIWGGFGQDELGKFVEFGSELGRRMQEYVDSAKAQTAAR